MVTEKMHGATGALHVVSEQNDPAGTAQVCQVDGLISGIAAEMNHIAAKPDTIAAAHNAQTKFLCGIGVRFVRRKLISLVLYPPLTGGRCHHLLAVHKPPASIAGVNEISPRR